LSDDDRDLVADVGQALALAVEDAVVTDRMHRRQVADPTPHGH
jgi:hypothetical protein